MTYVFMMYYILAAIVSAILFKVLNRHYDTDSMNLSIALIALFWPISWFLVLLGGVVLWTSKVMRFFFKD